jgi:hypothetical protein
MELPRIRGADLVLVSHADPPGPEVTYELTAAQAVFAPVFIELATSLVDEVSKEPTADAALLRVAQRLAAWERFFNARGSEGLSRSTELGLMGELLCLLTLGQLVGFRRTVEAWTGPTGTNHDFQRPRGAVEVKLTTSAAPERFRITSERQLDDSVMPMLCLFAILAQESASGTTSLGGLVDSARERINQEVPASLGLLEERLLQAGYAETDRALYKIRIAPREQHFLKVGGAFPRVRPSDLRPGVFAVTYEIPWVAIAPYRMPDEEVGRILSADK